jgi:glycosyltransferase involved in cell wall biosynthesis
MMKLSILMPCLNEAETLEICIRKAQDWLTRTGTLGEVVIADNGSTDGSQEIAKKCGARVINVPIKGYGSALYFGALEAYGEFIIMGDSDDSLLHCFSNIKAFFFSTSDINSRV